MAYAARSHFMIMPIKPSPTDVSAFYNATHPSDLHDYGNRAWCRLETYTFLCISELQNQPLHCTQ